MYLFFKSLTSRNTEWFRVEKDLSLVLCHDYRKKRGNGLKMRQERLKLKIHCWGGGGCQVLEQVALE